MTSASWLSPSLLPHSQVLNPESPDWIIKSCSWFIMVKSWGRGIKQNSAIMSCLMSFSLSLSLCNVSERIRKSEMVLFRLGKAYLNLSTFPTPKRPCHFLRICHCRCILGICSHSEGCTALWSWGCPSESVRPGWPPSLIELHQHMWPALLQSVWGQRKTAASPLRGAGAVERSGKGGWSSVRDAPWSMEAASGTSHSGRRRRLLSYWLRDGRQGVFLYWGGKRQVQGL